MLNALLEIGCEEIPARFMPGFLEDLKAKAEEKLARERLGFGKVVTLGTYRRLALYIEGLPVRQPDQADEVKGPSAEIAFDPSGKPTPAALGFARSQGVNPDQLVLRTAGPKNYVFARVVRKGESTEKVLQKLFPEIITALNQPLSMRWGDLDFKFIRPLHSLLALCGTKVVKFELAGIKASNRTFGHRYLKISNFQFPISNADIALYKRMLLKRGVVVGQEERREMVAEKVTAAAKKAGGQVLAEEELLNEVNFLIENPIAYVGKFKAEFLDLPQEVLITSMKKHQKYFPLADKGGKLLAKFVVVADGCKNPKVIEGNEKVLAARLADAQFFFKEDCKTPLKLRVPDLGKVLFFEKLGNLLQKSERIGKIAEWIGKRVKMEDASLKMARRVAELCKADLTTKMVFEFPELQGVMGKEYALLSEEEPRVAQGIMEHYLPRFAEDKIPEALEGTVVALADRVDTLVGAFSAGYVPSGSEDPYGLRRAAHGIIRIVVEKKIDLLLDELIEHAYKLYAPILPGALDLPKVKKGILGFIAGRLRPLLLEKGIRYDAADAALFGFNDILDVEEKAAAVNALLGEGWFAGVVASADRLSRIAGNAPREQVLEHDLAEKEEKELYELYLKINWEVSVRIKREEWSAAVRELAKLTDPIENFFDKILVMHEDERLKLNRLALLKSLEKLYLSVADFRKIVIEGKKT